MFECCSPGKPKGPFLSKNTTALESVVFRYRRSFSLSVPFPCLFCLEKTSISEHSPSRVAVVVANSSPRAEYTLGSIFSTAGSSGKAAANPDRYRERAGYCFESTVSEERTHSWHLSRQPLLCHPLSSEFALHGLRALESSFITFVTSRQPIWQLALWMFYLPWTSRPMKRRTLSQCPSQKSTNERPPPSQMKTVHMA